MAKHFKFRWLSSALLVIMAALTSLPAAQAAPLQQVCQDYVLDGSFEQHNAWILGTGPLAPTYVNNPTAADAWAVRLGNVDQPASTEAYSTVRQQITIPSNAFSADLSFNVWTSTEANPGIDRQMASLLVPGASARVTGDEMVWNELSSSGGFQTIRRSLNSAIGRTVDLTFAVYNDGTGGRTQMVVDAVMLTVCVPGLATPTFTPIPPIIPTATPLPTATALPPTATATVIPPTATPTVIVFPTATPLPPPPVTPSPVASGCLDLLANGDFEWEGSWQQGATDLCPVYVGAPNPTHNGVRSMAMGAVVANNATNINAYSSVQQTVTIPASAQTAQLRFFYYPISTAAAGGHNRQELVLLDPLNYGQTIAIPWRVTENANSWQYKEIDLTPYIGRTITLYFNARNEGDGTRTSMYLDQVQLYACNGTSVAAAVSPALAPAAALPFNFVTATPLGTNREMALGGVMPASGPTVVTVIEAQTGLPAATPIAVPTSLSAPTETPRGQQGLPFKLPSFNNPWLIIGFITALVLLGILLALLFFRNR